MLRPKIGIAGALDPEGLTDQGLADLASTETMSWMNVGLEQIEQLDSEDPLKRWPPFLSLRHLHDAYPPIGIIERGTLSFP